MTDRKSTAGTEPRNARGQFGPGNGGRRKGSRNKATLAAQLLLDRGARKLTKVCIDRALAGDSVALKLALERVLPAVRDRPLQIELPMPSTAADALATLGAIIRGAAEGIITASEAQKLAACVEAFARAHELSDFDARLQALEGRHHAK
jgi:hypothetical protein